MTNVRAGALKASCESCYFHRHLLCSLSESEPCGTYRPDGPDGLRPPRQLRLVFRHERRLHVAWASPTPQEQAALHR